MSINRRVALSGAFAIIATAILLMSGISRADSGGPIRLAINAPLTGPIAGWAAQFPNGFRMGIEDASRAHGIDPSVFSVDVQDDAGKPAQAVSILQAQSIRGFDAYISVATGPANANAAALDATGKPQFIAAFDPFITKDGADRFRVMANSKIEAPLFIEYARKTHAKTIHVIQLNMAYAEDEWSKIIIPALEKDGIKVSRERYELEQRDFKTIAQKAKVQAADLIYVCGYSFHLQPLLRELRTQGLIKQGHVMSVMDFDDLVYSGTPAPELQNVIFVAPIFDIPGKVPEALDWRKRYEARFKVKPTYVPAYAYDNATMLVDAYAKFGKINTQSLIASTPFNGLNGEIKLDDDRDVIATVTLAEVDPTGQIHELAH